VSDADKKDNRIHSSHQLRGPRSPIAWGDRLRAFRLIVEGSAGDEFTPNHPPSQLDYCEQITFFARNIDENFLAVDYRNDSIWEASKGDLTDLYSQLQHLIKMAKQMTPESWYNLLVEWFQSNEALLSKCESQLDQIPIEFANTK